LLIHPLRRRSFGRYEPATTSQATHLVSVDKLYEEELSFEDVL